MIFDSHSHYDDEQFDTDRDELLSSMEENGVGTIVNVSATYESCRRVIRMAEKYPMMYAAAGVHPDEVGSLDEEKFAHMKELLTNEKVVAVGEIGLIITGTMNLMIHRKNGLSDSLSLRGN